MRDVPDRKARPDLQILTDKYCCKKLYAQGSPTNKSDDSKDYRVEPGDLYQGLIFGELKSNFHSCCILHRF